MVLQFGTTLSRLEDQYRPRGSTNTALRSADTSDPDLDRISDMRKDRSLNEGLKTQSSQMHKTQSWCRRVCKTTGFSVCVACVIAANGIFIGCEANAIMTSEGSSLPNGIAWQLASLSFTLAFVVELAIRWVGHGSHFLWLGNEEFWWNLFDTVLIMLTVVEEVLRLAEVDIVAFGVLRLTRLLRVFRITRAFKLVRDFKELNIMVRGLVNCARPLFCACVLLFGLTYMMGILVSQLITEHAQSEAMRERNGQQRELDEESTKYIEDNFFGIWTIMYSLIEALGGGRDWGDIARLFWDVHWLLGLCLILYIFIGIFCILNLLTAVFLDAAQQVDTQTLVYAKADWVHESRKFFVKAMEGLPADQDDSFRRSSLKADGSETHHRISKSGFELLLDKAEIKAWLKDNGLDLFILNDQRREELFSIMDADGSGYLSVDEFVLALYELKGAASSMDLHRALHMIRSLQEQLHAISKRTPRIPMHSTTVQGA
jgi:hypothetical protein